MNNTSEYKRDSTGSFSLSSPLKITNQALIITFNVHEHARFTVVNCLDTPGQKESSQITRFLKGFESIQRLIAEPTLAASMLAGRATTDDPTPPFTGHSRTGL